MPKPQVVEMDHSVTLQQQGKADVGPIVFVNKFNVKPEHVDDFLEVWKAATMSERKQPGFISAQFHRGIAGSNVFLNYAIWESTEHHTRALAQPEFRKALEMYPPDTVESPHIFQKLAIPEVCVECPA